MPSAAKLLVALRDRKIARTLVVYAGAAWILLQALGFFGEVYDLPRKVFDAALFLALVGGACAVVLGWYHGGPRTQRLVPKEFAWLLVLVSVGTAGAYRILTRSPLEGVFSRGVVVVVEAPLSNEEEMKNAFNVTFEPPDASLTLSDGFFFADPTNLDMTIPGGRISVRQNPVWVNMGATQPTVRVVVGLPHMPVFEQLQPSTGLTTFEADSLVFTTPAFALRLSKAVRVMWHPDSLIIRLR